jgi:hypothetical protein
MTTSTHFIDGSVVKSEFYERRFHVSDFITRMQPPRPILAGVITWRDPQALEVA